jgi:hypothetical protein
MSTPQTSPGSTGLDLERTEQVKTALDMVLASQGFKRSERHARFLRFVCEATLSGEAAQLNEYLIAHRVFDRGADYSPGEDSVVRRQAFTLRQKLQEYYAGEGKSDGVRIELPVGRYVPTFRFPDQTPPLSAVLPAVEPADEPLQSKTFPWRWLLLALVMAAGFGTAGWLAGLKSRAQAAIDPVFSHIWGPLITDSTGSVICFSNALTAGIRQIEKPFPEETLTRGISLADEEADRIRRQFHLPAGGYFYMNPSLAHAKMGEALGSIPLTAMLVKAGVPVRATQSRYLNWQDFRNQNLILLGHDEANQWLDPILSKLPFRQGRTTSDKPRRIVVSAPLAGERAEYFPDYSKGQNPPAEDYALISFLNSIDGRHGLALVNGVNTEGTMMALEFLTEPTSLRSLEARLRNADPGHSGPWHFQAILHSELRDGVPANIELVALRRLP